MANLYYNHRLIIAFASQNQSDKQWTAGAEITWTQDGQRRSHSIGGLTDRFKNRRRRGKVCHQSCQSVD